MHRKRVHTSALVLFSGGQDSTTCLALALSKYGRVETIAFDYRQRHRVELESRLHVLREIKAQFPAWGPKLGQDHLLDLGVLGEVSETSLTRDTAFKMEQSGLPNTFVPGRNLLFLTLAAAVAYRRGLPVIVTGVCETDFPATPGATAAAPARLANCAHWGLSASGRLLPDPVQRFSALWLALQRPGGVVKCRDAGPMCY